MSQENPDFDKTLVYIFLYNVIQIKSNFLKLKHACGNKKFILIASNYCIDALSAENYACFDEIHEMPRNFHHVDYQVVEKVVKKYIREYGAHNIQLMTNEDSAQLACAKLNEAYNIPGFKTDEVLPFVDKTVSKALLQDIVKTPKFLNFEKKEYKKNKDKYLNEIVNKLKFPMFIKPIDLVSSLYTYQIDDFSSLKDVADKIITYEYEFEVDEFIDGDLFHCDMVVVDSKIKFFHAGEYAFPLAQFSKGKPLATIPVADKHLSNNLYKFSKKVVEQLKCNRGSYHLEVFVDKDINITFLEIAARTPGALSKTFYKIQYGFNIEEWHYLAHMGLLNKQEVVPSNKFVAWLTYPKQSGILSGFIKPILDVPYRFIEDVRIGENIKSAESLLDGACSIVFWDSSLKKVHDTFKMLKQYQPMKFAKAIGIDKKSMSENYVEIMDELFTTMPYLFWKNREGIYLGCNLNQAKAFNCTLDEYIGKTAFEILDDQETAQRITDIDEQIMKNGDAVIVEEDFITQYGKKVYLSQKMPRYNVDGEVIGLLGFAMDITDIKNAELEAKEKAEQLMKEKHALEVNYYKELVEQQKAFKKCLDDIQHSIQSYKINIINDKLGVTSNVDSLEKSTDIQLTKREQEILYFLSLNKSPKDIAAIISGLENKEISDKTIGSIINKKLYPKFDVFNIAQLIEKATSLKLIPFLLDAFVPSTE